MSRDDARVLAYCVMVLLGCFVLTIAAGYAFGQDRMMSTRPQGFFLDGHAENHKHYEGLRNHQNTSCCSSADCRPTTARWNNALGAWQALVNGQWQAVTNADLVLDDAFLQEQGRPRWSSQAHVCTAQTPGPDGTYRVYCLIPGASDQ